VRVDVDEARSVAAELLGTASDRWRHARAVARQAEQIAAVVGPADRDLLLCAAWLHDIGHAEALNHTGFACLDGANHLLENGWSARLAALVAHQCEARLMAGPRGLEQELARFPREDGAVADALVYADLAVGPGGERVSLVQRLVDLEERHAAEPLLVRQARRSRRRPLVASVERTEQRMCGRRRATAG
jgi:putative nucleotidyltransferase with HDIG domain